MSQQTVTRTTSAAIDVPIGWHLAPVNVDRLKRFLSTSRARHIALAEQFAVNKAEMLEWASRYPS